SLYTSSRRRSACSWPAARSRTWPSASRSAAEHSTTGLGGTPNSAPPWNDGDPTWCEPPAPAGPKRPWLQSHPQGAGSRRCQGGAATVQGTGNPRKGRSRRRRRENQGDPGFGIYVRGAATGRAGARGVLTHRLTETVDEIRNWKPMPKAETPRRKQMSHYACVASVE